MAKSRHQVNGKAGDRTTKGRRSSRYLPPPMVSAACGNVIGEPSGDDPGHLVAVLFQHHHMAVTEDAEIGELHVGGVHPRLA